MASGVNRMKRFLHIGKKEGEQELSKGQLRKEFGFPGLLAILFGTIVGSGIFVSPALILRSVANGGLVLLVWILAAIIALLGGLCYAELGSFVRNAGGEFAFVHKAFSFNGKQPFKLISEVLAFSMVWTQAAITRPASIAIIVLTFAEYVSKPFYPVYCEAPSTAVKLAAIAAMLILALINSFSPKGVVRIAEALSSVKFLALLFITVLGLYKIIVTKGDIFVRNARTFENDSWDVHLVQFFLAIYAANWAYDGWCGAAYIVEEVKSIKFVPWATVLAVVLVCVCYLLVNIAYIAVLTPGEIAGLSVGGEAIALPFSQKVIGKAGLVIIPIMVAVSTFGAAHGSLFGASRIVFASARAGYLPEALSGLHPKYSTPIPAVATVVAMSMVYVTAGNISDLITSFNAATWIMYGLSFVSLLIMRVTHRHEPRPFKVWIVVPALMVLISLALVVVPVKEKWAQSLGAFGVISLSVPVYFVFICDKTHPKVFTRISRRLTSLVFRALNVVHPQCERKETSTEETAASVDKDD